MGSLFSAHFFSHFRPDTRDGFTGGADALLVYLTSLKLKDPSKQVRTQHTTWKVGTGVSGLCSMLRCLLQTSLYCSFHVPNHPTHMRSDLP